MPLPYPGPTSLTADRRFFTITFGLILWTSTTCCQARVYPGSLLRYQTPLPPLKFRGLHTRTQAASIPPTSMPVPGRLRSLRYLAPDLKVLPLPILPLPNHPRWASWSSVWESAYSCAATSCAPNLTKRRPTMGGASHQNPRLTTIPSSTTPVGVSYRSISVKSTRPGRSSVHSVTPREMFSTLRLWQPNCLNPYAPAGTGIFSFFL